MAAPDQALIERFRADLEQITGVAPQSDRQLGIAVSGGSDSIALLLLAASAYPGRVSAATVDHGLRPESVAEAEMVGRVCAALDVPHSVLRLPAKYLLEGNLQDRARVARYICLHLWAAEGHGHLVGERRADWVATAHQRDDVAEGFLMRARRGAGLTGLAAMTTSRPLDGMDARIRLIRPLLGWSRTELRSVVEGAGLPFVSDHSNEDDRFDRARMRKLLASSPELRPERLARSASNLRDAEEAIEWWVRRELKTRIQEDDACDLWFDPSDLPFELKRRFVIRAISGIREENDIHEMWRTTSVDRLIRSLEAGVGGTLADVETRVFPRGWHFRLAPPRRSH